MQAGLGFIFSSMSSHSVSEDSCTSSNADKAIDFPFLEFERLSPLTDESGLGVVTFLSADVDATVGTNSC